jgi:hypothetical protein
MTSPNNDLLTGSEPIMLTSANTAVIPTLNTYGAAPRRWDRWLTDPEIPRIINAWSQRVRFVIRLCETRVTDPEIYISSLIRLEWKGWEVYEAVGSPADRLQLSYLRAWCRRLIDVHGAYHYMKARNAQKVYSTATSAYRSTKEMLRGEDDLLDELYVEKTSDRAIRATPVPAVINNTTATPSTPSFILQTPAERRLSRAIPIINPNQPTPSPAAPTSKSAAPSPASPVDASPLPPDISQPFPPTPSPPSPTIYPESPILVPVEPEVTVYSLPGGTHHYLYGAPEVYRLAHDSTLLTYFSPIPFASPDPAADPSSHAQGLSSTDLDVVRGETDKEAEGNDEEGRRAGRARRQHELMREALRGDGEEGEVSSARPRGL